jgi:hypothetical protein
MVDAAAGAVAAVERVLRLYRERYLGFTGRYFYQTACCERASRHSLTR